MYVIYAKKKLHNCTKYMSKNVIHKIIMDLSLKFKCIIILSYFANKFESVESVQIALNYWVLGYDYALIPIVRNQRKFNNTNDCI